MLFSVQEGVQVDFWTDGHWAWAVRRPDRGGALVRVRGEVRLQGRHRFRRPEGTPQPQTCLLTQVRTANLVLLLSWELLTCLLNFSSVLYLCWCLSFLSFFEYLTCCTWVNHLTLVYDKNYQTCHLQTLLDLCVRHQFLWLHISSKRWISLTSSSQYQQMCLQIILYRFDRNSICYYLH